MTCKVLKRDSPDCELSVSLCWSPDIYMFTNLCQQNNIPGRKQYDCHGKLYDTGCWSFHTLSVEGATSMKVNRKKLPLQIIMYPLYKHRVSTKGCNATLITGVFFRLGRQTICLVLILVPHFWCAQDKLLAATTVLIGTVLQAVLKRRNLYRQRLSLALQQKLVVVSVAW